MLLIILWVLCGLIADFMIIAIELRGKEFDPQYFDSETFVTMILLFLGGMGSLFIIFSISFITKIGENQSIKFKISKLFYKIANIGFNKKHETNAERLGNLLRGDKDDIDSASDEIWNMTKLNDEFVDYHQLRDRLKEECDK